MSFPTEDLPVGSRVRQYHATLTKVADNVWQGDAPCATDRWVNEWLDEGASLLPPLDLDGLRSRLSEIADDPAWSPVLRAHAKSAARWRPDDRVWPASLADHDIRAALLRSIGGCRPGPLKADMPDTLEKLRAWAARRAPSGGPTESVNTV